MFIVFVTFMYIYIYIYVFAPGDLLGYRTIQFHSAIELNSMQRFKSVQFDDSTQCDEFAVLRSARVRRFDALVYVFKSYIYIY